MKPRRFALTLAFATLFALACGGSELTRSGVSPPRNVTPKDNAEAELAALWLSGDLIAPQDLYETIRDDLANIRHEYEDSTAMVSIEFMPPWVPSQVMIRFTPEGKQRVQAGTYHELYDLNARFGLAEFDTAAWRWDEYGGAILKFLGRKNPIVMGESYEALDDVMWAERNGYVGDWSCIYPWEIDGGMSYLFRHGSGDCPAGCINNIFWYFRVVDGEIEYVGRYQMWIEPEPEWWIEGRTAFYAYRGYER